MSDYLNKVMQENWEEHRYRVMGLDLNPKEKKDNPKVYGAIWFDRECYKYEILREVTDNPLDAEMIIIVNDGIGDGSSFRYLFSVIGSKIMPFEPELKVGSIFRLAGKIIGDAESGKGKMTFGNPHTKGPDPGESASVSLGFFSEFGYDKDGGLIKL